MKSRMSYPGIDLKVVMDQSVYVRASVSALVQEGTIGAILCSLVILLFLGQWRMTIIAIVTLPLSVLVAIVCLNLHGPNDQRHDPGRIDAGHRPDDRRGHHRAGKHAPPSVDGSLAAKTPPWMAPAKSPCRNWWPRCALSWCCRRSRSCPAWDEFLFLPMTLAVMFAMASVYVLSLTLVPCASAYLLSHHRSRASRTARVIARAFAWVQRLIDRGIEYYVKALDLVLRHKTITIAGSFILLAVTLAVLLPVMRRDFFPEVDSGAFEIAARAPAGTRIEETEKLVEQVENYIKEKIPKEDLDLIVSELGLTANWSAAYTVNAGTMDAIMKIQLKEHRSKSSQEYIRILRDGLTKDRAIQFAGVFFRFRRPGARCLE